ANSDNATNPNAEPGTWQGVGAWQNLNTKTQTPEQGEGAEQGNEGNDGGEGTSPAEGASKVPETGPDAGKAPLFKVLEESRRKVAALSLGGEAAKKEMPEEYKRSQRKQLYEEEKGNYEQLALQKAQEELAELTEINPDMTDAEKQAFFAERQMQMWQDVNDVRDEIFKDTKYGKVVNWLGKHKVVRTLAGFGAGAAVGVGISATGGLAAPALIPVLGVAARMAKGKVLVDAGMSASNRDRDKNTKIDKAQAKLMNLPPLKWAAGKMEGFVQRKYDRDLNQRLGAISREEGLSEHERSAKVARANYEAGRTREKYQEAMAVGASWALIGAGTAAGTMAGEMFLSDMQDLGSAAAGPGGVEDVDLSQIEMGTILSSHDLSGSGTPNVFGYDLDGNGSIDSWMLDTTGDGIGDTPMLDLDGDGIPDVLDVANLTYDVNQDYGFVASIDINGDGKEDIIIQGHDSIPAEAAGFGTRFANIEFSNDFNDLSAEQQSAAIAHAINTVDSKEPAALASHAAEVLSPQQVEELFGSNMSAEQMAQAMTNDYNLHQGVFETVQTLRSDHTFAMEQIPDGLYGNAYLSHPDDPEQQGMLLHKGIVTNEQGTFAMVERDENGDVVAMYKVPCSQPLHPVPAGTPITPTPSYTPQTPGTVVPPVVPPVKPPEEPELDLDPKDPAESIDLNPDLPDQIQTGDDPLVEVPTDDSNGPGSGPEEQPSQETGNGVPGTDNTVEQPGRTPVIDGNDPGQEKPIDHNDGSQAPGATSPPPSGGGSAHSGATSHEQTSGPGADRPADKVPAQQSPPPVNTTPNEQLDDL
ncbi:hypothetical protein FWF93_02575, partial [Candidatus Saccharibacteria bacterium]|nr:hypothetical protein [Candidatus Saccharibacteria bacterium]